jgi:hypothetical protein
MPDPTFINDAVFVSVYNNYSTYLGYMQQWANSVSLVGQQIQNDPNFAVGLLPSEQQGVQTAVTAAKAFLKAVPITLLTPI